MAISVNDKFLHVGSPGTATTLSAPGYTTGVSTTINVGSTGSFPTDTAVIFGIDTATTTSGTQVRTPGSYCVFVGIVTSGTSIGSVQLLYGTPQNYVAGALTRVYITVSSVHTNRLIDGILTQHNQDGTHGAVTATSLSSSTITENGATLQTVRAETRFDFIASGCVWSGTGYGSTLVASMTSGVVYIGGKRVTVASVTSRTFTASKDTYVDVDNTGTLTYTEVVNNAASPTLAANSIRSGIIVTGASNIASAGSVNQGQETAVLPIVSSVPYAVTDSLGNLICPRDPQRRVLGHRQLTTSTSNTTSTPLLIPGASFPYIVPNGRKIELELYLPMFYNSGASGGNIGYSISIDGVQSNSTSIPCNTFMPGSAYMKFETTLASGSHTVTAYIIGLNASTVANAPLSSTQFGYVRANLI